MNVDLDSMKGPGIAGAFFVVVAVVAQGLRLNVRMKRVF